MNTGKTLEEVIKEVEDDLDYEDLKEELGAIVVAAKCSALMVKIMIDEFKRLGIPEELWVTALKEGGKK